MPEGIADLVRACLRKDRTRPTLELILERTGAEDTVADGRSRDPWLRAPSSPSWPARRYGSWRRRTPKGPSHRPPRTTRAPRGTLAAPPDHVPTLAAPHPAYGHPQQYPAPPRQPMPPPTQASMPMPMQVPVPHNPYAADAVAYGTPRGDHPDHPGHADDLQDPPRRGRRSAVLLTVIALVVALAAGGTVYAFMNGDGTPARAPPRSARRPRHRTDRAPSPPRRPPPPRHPPEEGRYPRTTWAPGPPRSTHGRRRHPAADPLPGRGGRHVLRLVADGDAYHCEFPRPPAGPAPRVPLEVGPSTVTTGEPLSSCCPGEATEVTLLSTDGCNG